MIKNMMMRKKKRIKKMKMNLIKVMATVLMMRQIKILIVMKMYFNQNKIMRRFKILECLEILTIIQETFKEVIVLLMNFKVELKAQNQEVKIEGEEEDKGLTVLKLMLI